MLAEHELWKRMKKLEGKTIHTLVRNRSHTIDKVDDKCVFTKQRKTPVRFNGEWGLYENYRVLHRDGYLLIGDNASGPYLAMAIILAAVPDEAEEAYEGIKLR